MKKNIITSLATAVAVVAMVTPAASRAETATEEPDAFLEYIEATGTQYIDTGVNAETGLKARCDFAWASGTISGNDWSLLDAAIDSSSSDKRNRILMCHLYGGGGKPFFGYGVKQRKNPSGSFAFVGGRRYEIVTDMSDTNSLQLVQNGKNTFNATDLETFKTNGIVNLHLNLYVFACNLSGKASWYAKGKLYEMKIFKKNATTGEFDLLRHYIPCIKAGRVGLYDKANGTISYSDGSDEFNAGPVLDKPLDFVKWIWGNGSQWFDTRVWGRSGIKSEIDISVREYSGDRCILGVRQGNNRIYPAYQYEKQFRYAWGTMPSAGNTTVVHPTNDVSYYMDTRYFIKSDIRDGYQSVLVSKNGGNPTELHKNGVAYNTGTIAITPTSRSAFWRAITAAIMCTRRRPSSTQRRSGTATSCFAISCLLSQPTPRAWPTLDSTTGSQSVSSAKSGRRSSTSPRRSAASRTRFAPPLFIRRRVSSTLIPMRCSTMSIWESSARTAWRCGPSWNGSTSRQTAHSSARATTIPKVRTVSSCTTTGKTQRQDHVIALAMTAICSWWVPRAQRRTRNTVFCRGLMWVVATFPSPRSRMARGAHRKHARFFQRTATTARSILVCRSTSSQ